jgi:hypothetical protein
MSPLFLLRITDLKKAVIWMMAVVLTARIKKSAWTGDEKY